MDEDEGDWVFLMDGRLLRLCPFGREGSAVSGCRAKQEDVVMCDEADRVGRDWSGGPREGRKPHLPERLCESGGRDTGVNGNDDGVKDRWEGLDLKLCDDWGCRASLKKRNELAVVVEHANVPDDA